jgi:hypothetical protein
MCVREGERELVSEWMIRTLLFPPKRQLSPTIFKYHLTFEGFMAVTTKNVIFWDVMQYGTFRN